MLLFLKNKFNSPGPLTGHLRRDNLPVSQQLYGAIFCLLLLPGALQAGPVKRDTIEALDRQFQDFSRDFYRKAGKSNQFALEKYTAISTLKLKVDDLIKNGNTSQAISLVHFNFSLLRDNIDALETVALTEVLLNHNDWHGARRILNTAQIEAGKVASSNISYTFAKYFMARKKWQQALEHLQGVINDLSADNANYARIMVGTILQYQKKHRQAVSFYSKVAKDSKYYPAAVLNTAIAYIRQDWWTDAYIAINDLIKHHPDLVTEQMVDHLNLVLGYALLRKQYFRNSRDAFRNVGLKSPYTNKALLGIALSAANQEDYIGALNAISILKNNKTTDLPVDESYLLLPYTYAKLKQNMTATSAYTDAIKYYQERISHLQSLSGTDEAIFDNVRILSAKTSIEINNNVFDYTRYYPKSFFDNYLYLLKLGKTGFTNSQLQAEYAQLLTEHKKILARISRHLLSERIDFIQSYLNQARYGLARLYDSSLASNK